ncbi:prolyl aminopeptidase [Mycoplasmopsis anatis]|uniref:Proline iminopeptidase n=1 Tax=Mycoplasmopsis anatis 1340 TaxID=1034808 RepID=F9QDX6_9BACT|nr:prolyl aminopeptidase [Mycoplasmopsis anatis]AWX70168.1 prolyl aminopeptidase [Mycoplasmopsis anatis]EGS29054.1 prolyl aminopeptidase [Mycoplasmopsis anatis 1340]VEU73389.1 Proline iminopeptidase [Mycoplasmopsis anatis]
MYKNIIPYKSGFLNTESEHKIYYEVSGNQEGVPVIFLHGGPGGSSSEKHREFFDPKYYKIIIFDQRGCGKSTPSCSLINNTTDYLIQDINNLTKMLDIDKFILFGGSWGSTLALIYAIRNPERVLSLVLRGIFLCRKSDIDWLYQNGVEQFFPEYFEDYMNYLSAEERKDALTSYYNRMTSSDRTVALQAATKFANLESITSTIKTVEPNSDDKHILEIATLEAHYFVNDSFLPSDNYILENTNKIENIPTYIVHGRYDMVCRPSSAYDLHKKLKNSQLYYTNLAGHSLFEEETKEKLFSIMEELKIKL